MKTQDLDTLRELKGDALAVIRAEVAARDKRIAELERDYASIASALGVLYIADGVASVPGPIEVVLGAVADRTRLAHRCIEAEAKAAAVDVLLEEFDIDDECLENDAVVRSLLTNYVDRVSKTEAHRKAVRELNAAAVETSEPTVDTLTPEERELVESIRRQEPRGYLKRMVEVTDRIAPKPVEHDPVADVLAEMRQLPVTRGWASRIESALAKRDGGTR